MHYEDLDSLFAHDFDFGVNELNDDQPNDEPAVNGIDWDNDQEIDDFIIGGKSKNTRYKDKSAENRLNQFMVEIDPTETRKFYDLNKEDLNKLMCKFFIHAKKIDKKCIGGDQLYEPDTYNSFRNGWQRIIDSMKLGFNIKTDPEFEQSRQVMAAKRKKNTKEGKGNKPNAARNLEPEEVDILYQLGYFGTGTPVVLQRTMWWIFTTSFGYRARDESVKLKYGDLKLCKDMNDHEYLEWDKERGSKCRTGEYSGGHQRAFNCRAYATHTDRCPVAVYKEFIAHRSEESKTDDFRFYLTPKPINRVKNAIWYYDTPLGHNQLGKFLFEAKQLLNSHNGNTGSCSKSKVSNHSARKTTITSLIENDINPLHVSQLTGHKNTDSLKSYYSASSKMKKKMSDIINNPNNETTSTHHKASTSTITICNTENNPSTSTSAKNTTIIASQETVNQSSSSSNIMPGESAMKNIFNGATMHNCVLNLNFNSSSVGSPGIIKRRKRIIIDSDSD